MVGNSKAQGITSAGLYHLLVDKDLFEILLHQDESETLDFKEDQYPFEGADDNQKSEILKDILAFANSWRRDDAYILIGVREVRGGRSAVCGISTQLLNRNLQQFVKSKVNRPLAFSYSEKEFEGHKIGVLAIPVQDRPFFLMKDYGRLKAKTVYVRRGDTTDDASPDEVYKMGSVAHGSESQPTLELSFADLRNRSELGTEIALECKHYQLPGSIPDYRRPAPGPLGIDLNSDIGMNYDFLRDIAEFVYAYGKYQAVGFTVNNPSTIAAANVNLRFRIASSVAEVRSKEDMPSEPSTNRMARFRPGSPFHKSPVTVSEHGDFYEIRIDIGTVQPGTNEWSADEIFVGGKQPIELPLEVTISADNLRVPEIHALKIRTLVESLNLPLTEIKQIAKRVDPDV